MKKSCIGIFDSGFGGLIVMKDIVKALPEFDFVYLGDSARIPYGSRSSELVLQFCTDAVDFLFANNCDLIVFACNTASSEALKVLQQNYLPKLADSRRILGVIIPAAEEACAVTKNERVGVIATEGTVNSGSFVREIKKVNPKVEVFQNACPLLVPIVEAGEHESEITDLMLNKYLQPLIENDIDTLILGCTHYGLLEKKIRAILGDKVNIISEGPVVAKKLRAYLDRHPEITKNISTNSSRTFFSSDLTDRFRILGSEFFGQEIEVKRASLG